MGVSSGNATITASTVDGGFTDTASVSVLGAPDCVQGTNLALNKTLFSFTGEQAGNEASNIIDGDTSNRWSAMNFPQSAVIDLGESYNVGGFNVFPFQDRDYQYLIEGSNSPTTGFSTLVDRQNNTESASVLSNSISTTVVRYLRFTVTGANTYTGPWVSIQEVEVICAGATASIADDTFKAFSVYPNPFTETLTINLQQQPLKGIITAQMYDVAGRFVFTKTLTEQTSFINFPQELTHGLYFLQIIDENGTLLGVEKVLKTKE